jgi:hypothetical protein
MSASTLISANQLLGGSIRVIDGFLVGEVRGSECVQLISDLTCGSLLLANVIAARSGCTLAELSEMPLDRMPELIRALAGQSKD